MRLKSIGARLVSLMVTARRPCQSDAFSSSVRGGERTAGSRPLVIVAARYGGSISVLEALVYPIWGDACVANWAGPRQADPPSGNHGALIHRPRVDPPK